jgi:S1-C subfamily serine protease
MLARPRFFLLAVLAQVLAIAPAPADPLSRVEVGKLGKSATAFVEVKANGRTSSGSAFCVHSSGLFITNEHVVRPSGQPGIIRLILDSGLTTQRVLTASIVRSDKESDLALLRVESRERLPALMLGSLDDLTELMELVAFGFPFGQALSPQKQEYPAVSVNVGNVTSLRRKGNELHRIQLDAALNPGNSGGPVLDRNGKVVGMVVSGVRASGVNFAIPVNELTRFLSKPDLQFTPPALSKTNIYGPVQFQARAAQFVPFTDALAVELRLRSGNGPERKYAMEPADGVYQVTVTPLSEPAGPLLLRVTAFYTDSSVTGSVVDRTFRIDGKAYRLSGVRRLSGSPKGQVTLRDGRTLEGSLAGLDAVAVQLGKQEVQLNLGRAAEVTVDNPAEIDSIACTIVVTLGGKEVERKAATLTFPSH